MLGIERMLGIEGMLGIEQPTLGEGMECPAAKLGNDEASMWSRACYLHHNSWWQACSPLPRLSSMRQRGPGRGWIGAGTGPPLTCGWALTASAAVGAQDHHRQEEKAPAMGWLASRPWNKTQGALQLWGSERCTSEILRPACLAGAG
jgi:hypothetical protein